MVLITIPNMPRVKVEALLDLIAKKGVEGYIDAKIHLCSGGLETHVTPGISVWSDGGRVSGLKSLAELRELFLGRDYQLLKVEVRVRGGFRIEMDILKHAITQKGEALAGRPLSRELLATEGLLGGDGITSFLEEFK